MQEGGWLPGLPKIRRIEVESGQVYLTTVGADIEKGEADELGSEPLSSDDALNNLPGEEEIA